MARARNQAEPIRPSTLPNRTLRMCSPQLPCKTPLITMPRRTRIAARLRPVQQFLGPRGPAFVEPPQDRERDCGAGGEEEGGEDGVLKVEAVPGDVFHLVGQPQERLAAGRMGQLLHKRVAADDPEHHEAAEGVEGLKAAGKLVNLGRDFGVHRNLSGWRK